MTNGMLAICFYLTIPFMVLGFTSPLQTRAKYGSSIGRFESPGPISFAERVAQSKSSKMVRTKMDLAHTISLDTAILPGRKFGLGKIGFCVLLLTLLGKQLFKSVSSDSYEESNSKSGSKASKDSKSQSAGNIIESFLKALEIITESLTSKISASVEVLKNAVSSVFGGGGGENIKLDDWNVCKLNQRESLFGGRYTRYRFELEDSSSKLPLYIGQEIVMCSTDSKGRILKENFFPISSSSLRGHFEVLTRRNTGVGAYDKFARSLDGLEQGDEIAFKGGSYRLNYEGADDPIKYVTVVSTGVGIAPSLQILNGILSDRDSTVEDMELLWMNSDNRDFVCEKDVAALEKKYEKKLFVTRVNEMKLFEQDLTKKDIILGALSGYETGRIAVVCGSDDAIVKVKDLLLNVGYPANSILSIST